MRTFETKVQYRDFEKGEFTKIAERTFEQVSDLILEYDWLKQRFLQSIKLTCPSVTIDNSLKLGPYYQGKFVLYYLHNGKLYQSIQDSLESALLIIAQYYSLEDILPHFERLKWRFQAQKHFITNPFMYTVTTRRIIGYLSYSIGLLTALITGMAIILCIPFDLSELGILGGFWLVYIGGNLIYFFNYYQYSRNKFIRISKGLDHFEYGLFDDFKVYSKLDIVSIEYFKTGSSRHPYSENVVTRVFFTNGDIIILPSLLINNSTFAVKITHRPKVINTDVFMPRSISASGNLS